jgi:hypothetical protein
VALPPSLPRTRSIIRHRRRLAIDVKREREESRREEEGELGRTCSGRRHHFPLVAMGESCDSAAAQELEREEKRMRSRRGRRAFLIGKIGDPPLDQIRWSGLTGISWAPFGPCGRAKCWPSRPGPCCGLGAGVLGASGWAELLLGHAFCCGREHDSACSRPRARSELGFWAKLNGNFCLFVISFFQKHFLWF